MYDWIGFIIFWQINNIIIFLIVSKYYKNKYKEYTEDLKKFNKLKKKYAGGRNISHYIDKDGFVMLKGEPEINQDEKQIFEDDYNNPDIARHFRHEMKDDISVDNEVNERNDYFEQLYKMQKYDK